MARLVTTQIAFEPAVDYDYDFYFETMAPLVDMDRLSMILSYLVDVVVAVVAVASATIDPFAFHMVY